MSRPLRVLAVEDSEDDVALLLRELRRGGFEPVHLRVDTADAMKAALEEKEWDVIISDHNMPRFNANRALSLLQALDLDIPFIILSGSIGEDIAVGAMKAGAHDFIVKGKLARLVPAVERELREAKSRRERKKIEAQLVQAQKMEAIGQLAGGIAHDFNNFLSVILGYSDFVGRALHDEGASEALKNDVEEIKSAAMRAASLTSQLLAFSRHQVLQPVLMDLNSSVSDMEKLCRRLIGEDIGFITNLDPTLRPIKADPGQVEQLIMNLVVNARDAMPDGGKIVVRTGNAQLDDTSFPGATFNVKPGRYVFLSVGDTGCGMAKEVKARIFEPFFTTKEKGRGTGLGLATVYGTVKQSGGYIWVDSEPGKGTTFKIFLPMREEAVDGVAPRNASSFRASGSETVLTVEDEAKIRAMVRRFLESRGYRVLEAANAEEAIALFQAHGDPIHLVVTDVIMPGLNGLELSARLKSMRPEVKILYVTGYTDHAVFRQEVPEFETKILMKPFTSDELTQKVREVLDAPE